MENQENKEPIEPNKKQEGEKSETPDGNQKQGEQQAIFKGKRTLARTPPGHTRLNSWSGITEKKRKEEQEKQEINAAKLKLAEEQARKRPRKGTPEKEDENNQDDSEEEDLTDKSNYEVITYWTKQIKLTTSREVNHKISFTKQDQKRILECIEGIKDAASSMIMERDLEQNNRQLLEEKMEGMARIIDIQRWQAEENMILKNMIMEQCRDCDKLLNHIKEIKTNQRIQQEDIGEIKLKIRDLGKENIKPQAHTMEEAPGTSMLTIRETDKESTAGTSTGKTYAQITRANTETEKKKKEPVQWTSPQKEERWETVIRKKRTNIEGQETDRNNIKEIKKCLMQAKIEEPLKGMWETRGGGVIIQCQSDNQRTQINNILREKEEYTIKETNVQRPILKLTGIDKGWTDDEFIEELIRQNEQRLPDTTGWKEEMKILGRKPCRNPSKENILIQARADIFKAFVKTETLTFDLFKLYAEEHISVAICYKCCNYGHVQKFCQGTITCHKCGGDHEPRDCQSQILDCVNCKRVNLEIRGHSARDMDCPVYRRKREQVRNSINYS